MHRSLPHCFKSLCLFNTKCPKEQANVQENKGITLCALQTGHYLTAFLLPFVLFLRAELHLTPLFISSYAFATNVIYESTQGLCVVITILFSSLTFAASSKKAKFFICDPRGTYNRNCSPRFFFQNKSFSSRLVHKILSVQKHSTNRRTTLSRPPQNIILHVQKHFTDRRSGLYGTLYANYYTFSEFFIIFHLTTHQKYNNLMYVRRTNLLPPYKQRKPRKVS